MRNRIELEQMPRFWEPRPSRFWDWVLGPAHRRVLHGMHGIERVEIEGIEKLVRLDARDGMLICPNHSYTGDGSVMLEFARRAPRRVCIMAAWHSFRSKLGLRGWLLQRQGCFSVDREGCDRRAIKQAVELLTTGQALCIFPEGEIYHMNERLTPLREGVAFIAASAQRELEKSSRSKGASIRSLNTAGQSPVIPSPGTPGEGQGGGSASNVVSSTSGEDPHPKPPPEYRGRGKDAAAFAQEGESLPLPTVWIVPVAIRYQFIGDILPALHDAMGELERRVLLTPRPEQPLHERIARFGEVALTIKEREHLGREGSSGDLKSRIAGLAEHILSRSEQAHFGKPNPDEPIPVRVKLLRQHLLERVWEQDPPEPELDKIREALSDVHLALQLYSYPGDYVGQEPSRERMAETIEKFEEDVYGAYSKPKGKRLARVTVGEPISVREQMAAGGKMRVIAERLTGALETSLKSLMAGGAGEAQTTPGSPR